MEYEFRTENIIGPAGTIHCRIAGNPNGMPVLFIHGLSGFSMDFETIPGLPNDLFLISPDLPGFGDSAQTEDHHYPQSVMVEAMVAVLDHFNAAHVLAVGQSRGGRIALGVPYAAKDRISAVVMVDAAPGVPPETQIRVARNIVETSRTFFTFEEAMTLFGSRFPKLNSHGLKSRLQRYLCQDAEGNYHVKRDESFRENSESVLQGNAQEEKGPDFWSLFKGLPCPIFVIRALKSNMITDELNERMRQLRPDLIEYSLDCGHNVPAEASIEFGQLLANIINTLR